MSIDLNNRQCIMHSLGPLAQSVEQRTFNPLVESSSLSRPTNFQITYFLHSNFFDSETRIIFMKFKYLPDYITSLLPKGFQKPDGGC